MTTERKKTGIEIFISTYFSNFGKLLKVNAIFALPFAVAIGACCGLSFLAPKAFTVIMPLVALLAAPFYSGVVMSCKNIYFGTLKLGVFKEFIKSVKGNFKAYILHGAVAYIAFVGCYHGIVIYYNLARSSWIFYIMLFVSVLLALFFLFFLYGLFMMSAFFDLKLKDVYKNSLLMTFGELKANLFATLGIAAYALVLFVPVGALSFFYALLSQELVTCLILGYIAFAVIFLAPSGISTIVIAAVYPNMKRVITGEAQAALAASQSSEDEDEIYDDTAEGEYAAMPQVDVEALLKSSGDYVYYRGKMIKKSQFVAEIEKRKED